MAGPATVSTSWKTDTCAGALLSAPSRDRIQGGWHGTGSDGCSAAVLSPRGFGGFLPRGRGAVVRFRVQGQARLAHAIVTAAILTWGFARRRYWAWWCAIAFLGLMTVSSTVTFLAISPQQIVAGMPFAPLEAAALSGVPMQGYHLALLVGAIPAATLAAVAASRRGLRVQGVRAQAN